MVNNCLDDNAQTIQQGEFRRYFEADPMFVGITHELEASFNMANLLKTFRHGKRGGILVNIAHRKSTKQNGAKFGYFPFERAWVVTTTGEETLSLAEYLGITKTIRILDIEETTDFLIEEGFVSPDDRGDIIRSQFRSAVFSPAVLAYLLTKGEGEIPHISQPIRKVPEIVGSVCWVDNFGNLKLAKTADKFEGLKPGTSIGTEMSYFTSRHLPYYPHLSLVPHNQAAITRGSSGVGTHHLLELVIKGLSAAKAFGLKVGDKII